MTADTDAKPKKRIVGLFTELLGHGGVQEAGRHTAASLTQYARRCHSSVCCLSLNDPRRDHSLLFDHSEILFLGCQRSKINFVASALRTTGAFSTGETRLVVAGHPNLAPIALACKYVIPRTKTIVICHGVEVWSRLPPLRHGALINSDYVLAPSYYTMEKLITVQSIPRDKIRLLPWPLSEDFLCMANDPAALAMPAGFPQGRVLLTVGRWAASERYKGADELIRSVATLCQEEDNLQLVVVGGGDDIPRLRQVAADHSIANRVHFLGILSRENLAACYAHAEIFALPSTGEGFGLVFLEAMAFGKALVAAAAGGAIDLIEDRASGLLVPPGDQEALVRALRSLLVDESLRSQLGKKAVAVVRERYRFGVFSSKIESIIEECNSVHA
jgi:phosphatidyl-myo-inositol dimannoside synthase